jgi:hypothetical protein
MTVAPALTKARIAAMLDHARSSGMSRRRRVPDPLGTDPANHAAALHMVTMQGGVFGCVSDSAAVIEATTWEDAL